MRSGRARAAAGLLAFAAIAAASGVRAAGDVPNLGTNVMVGALAAGGTYIVRPAAGAPVAAVELWYRAPSTGFENKPQTGIARIAAQTVAASKPIIGDSLGRVVSAAGGRLSITVYADSVAISAAVPSAAAPAVLKAMTTAYFAPVLTDDGFRIAQRDVASEAFIDSLDPETIVRDAVFAQLFTGGPQHYPVVGGPHDVAALSLASARSFAVRAFRSGNATLVVSGAVDASLLKSAVAGRPGDDAPEAASVAQVAASVSPLEQRAQPSGGGYGWIGPPIADQREATAMDFIADYLFRPDNGLVSRQVARYDANAFFVGQFITLHDPGVMFVAFSGKDLTPLRGFVDAGIATMRAPLERSDFNAAIRTFKYHIFSDLQTPTQLADNFGWYSVEGAPEYAPGVRGDAGAYFTAADSLTPQFVASVAQKYLAQGGGASITLRPEPALSSSPAPKATSL